MGDKKCAKCGWPEPCPCKERATAQRTTVVNESKKVSESFREVDELIKKLKERK